MGKFDKWSEAGNSPHLFLFFPPLSVRFSAVGDKIPLLLILRSARASVVCLVGLLFVPARQPAPLLCWIPRLRNTTKLGSARSASSSSSLLIEGQEEQQQQQNDDDSQEMRDETQLDEKEGEEEDGRAFVCCWPKERKLRILHLI